jgi:hypothetical protein
MTVVTETQYLAGFLVTDDLPGMRHVQDSRRNLEDQQEAGFVEHHGLYSGLSAWMGADDAPVWRLVDIRMAFADEGSAIAFHREQLRQNAEGWSAVPGAPRAGTGCTVFGGSQPLPIAPEVVMTSYFYVFRVGTVVAKLFVAQSVALPADTLGVTDVFVIARRVEARLVAAGTAEPGVTP